MHQSHYLPINDLWSVLVAEGGVFFHLSDCQDFGKSRHCTLVSLSPLCIIHASYNTVWFICWVYGLNLLPHFHFSHCHQHKSNRSSRFTSVFTVDFLFYRMGGCTTKSISITHLNVTSGPYFSAAFYYSSYHYTLLFLYYILLKKYFILGIVPA